MFEQILYFGALFHIRAGIFFLKSLSGTEVLQKLENISAEKDLKKRVEVRKGEKGLFLKRAFSPPRLCKTLFTGLCRELRLFLIYTVKKRIANHPWLIFLQMAVFFLSLT